MMKKTLVKMTLVLFIAAFSLSLTAQHEGRLNLFGNLGFAVSDFEGLFLDIGAELQLTENIYGQFLIDYYFNPSKEELASGVDDKAYGFNLYGVFKHSASEKLNLFAKAGIHYTTVKLSATSGGVTYSATEGDFGIAGGAGIEYILNDKMTLLFGTTIKYIFAQDTGNWFKFYGGLSYRLK